MDPVEQDLNRYLKELEEADKLDARIDELTDKKWEELTKEVEVNLASPNAWDEEFTASRIINREPAETAVVFEDLIREHLESERFVRLLTKLIASDAGSEVRVCLAQLHAASHARNLAVAEAAQ